MTCINDFVPVYLKARVKKGLCPWKSFEIYRIPKPICHAIVENI